VRHYLRRFSREMGREVVDASPEALAVLAAYPWPGNVRELENVIERAVALEQTALVLPESLPMQVRTGVGTSSKSAPASSAGHDAARGLPDISEGFDLEALGEDFYRHYIALALEKSGGVQSRAAEMLGMTFRSFRYYAKKFNLK
jgi:two-component system response regulator PilR (NtrC family)